jgi:hypothetical protein
MSKVLEDTKRHIIHVHYESILNGRSSQLGNAGSSGLCRVAYSEEDLVSCWCGPI